MSSSSLNPQEDKTQLGLVFISPIKSDAFQTNVSPVGADFKVKNGNGDKMRLKTSRIIKQLKEVGAGNRCNRQKVFFKILLCE